MIKKFKKKANQMIMGLFGNQKNLRKLQRENRQIKRKLKSQKQQLDKATSYLEFATIDDRRMRESTKFQNFHKIISLLSPMDISEANYRRFGKDNDGGYVMLDDFSSRRVDAAYSFGINNDVSWDEDIAKLGIHVYMYDHTIEKLPKQNRYFHFFKEGVTGNPEEKGLETLSNLVVRNGHENSNDLILKMDIEGYEWSVFRETPSSVINQFSQIVIEFHGIDPNKSTEELSHELSILKKIKQTHQPVHVHANSHCTINWLGEIALPRVLEVTYIRHADYADRLIQNTRTFPTEIDQPTFPWLNDIYLGTFNL